MLDNRNPKQIRERSFGERGPAGKPRNRWDDEVREVTAILVNTRKCRSAAGSRCDWRKKTRGGLGQKTGRRAAVVERRTKRKRRRRRRRKTNVSRSRWPAQRKTWVGGRWDAGIAGSNPAGNLDVCLL